MTHPNLNHFTHGFPSIKIHRAHVTLALIIIFPLSSPTLLSKPRDNRAVNGKAVVPKLVDSCIVHRQHRVLHEALPAQ